MPLGVMFRVFLVGSIAVAASRRRDAPGSKGF
jgi:hypothetical protein